MFEFYKSQVEPNSPVTMVLPTNASETYSVGEALKLSSGALTKASGTDKPEYISAANYVAPATGNKEIQVCKVNADQIYRVPLSVAGDALVVGDKVTISDDGLNVTATTENGTVSILEIEGTEAGSYVKVHF